MRSVLRDFLGAMPDGKAPSADFTLWQCGVQVAIMKQEETSPLLKFSVTPSGVARQGA